MEDIIMIFTEERSATIKFGSIFKRADSDVIVKVCDGATIT